MADRQPSWYGPRHPEWRCEDDVLELGPRFEPCPPSRFEGWTRDSAYRLPSHRSATTLQGVPRG